MTLGLERRDLAAAEADQVYADLTDGFSTFLHVENLLYRAAERYPHLVPSRAEVAADLDKPLKEKAQVEIAQGLFLSAILSRPLAGRHFIHASLRPRARSLELLEQFKTTGRADLGTVIVERHGKAGHVLHHNPKFLNAQDDSTFDAMETAVDLVLLDDQIEIGVLRGDVVQHSRYAGRRIFSSGINLTRLYWGKIPFLFYLVHDLGYVNKLYRGLTDDEIRPHEPERTLEKPWIAAVEGFAIGGGCQLLLVLDRVLAEAGSYFNLPARKEGIIPGAANLRLTRFVGDRLARQGILFDRRFDAESPEGSMLCDEVVPVGEMDAAIERTVEGLTSSGVVSAAGNRKALRVAQEPLEQFQAYMALYCREQAYCHFSPALIRNLEVNWGAERRTP